MKDDARKINISMEALLRVFGERVKKSIIVLTTKWDKVYEDECEQLTNYLEKLINLNGLEYLKWQNNIKVRGRLIITEAEVLKQISVLGAYIKKCQPYCVKEMDSLLLRRNKLAEELRENDPNRYVTDNTEVEVDVPESYTEMMTIPYTHFIPFTEIEIEELAKKMLATDTGEAIATYKMVEYNEKVFLPKTEIIKECVSWREPSSWREPPSWTKRYVPRTTYSEKEVTKTQYLPDTKQIPRDINFFKKFYIGQGKAVNIDREIPIERVRLKKTKKIIPSQHERHEFDYYINLATQELDEEIRNSIRSNIV